MVEKSLVLGDSGKQIKTASRNGDFDQFGITVESTALAVCQLTEATVQAAYLVGVADASSEAGIRGLVDQAQFVQAQQAITSACQNLLSPSSTQEQVSVCFTYFTFSSLLLCWALEHVMYVHVHVGPVFSHSYCKEHQCSVQFLQASRKQDQ